MAKATAGSVQIEGLNQKIRSLQQMGVELDDLKDVFADIAEEGAEVASSFAPVKSGALAESIRGNRAKNKAVVTAGTARGTPYAGAINYGWPKRNIKPALFLQKADDVMSEKAEKMLIDGLDDLTNRLDLQ